MSLKIVEVTMDKLSDDVLAAWRAPGRKGLADSVLVDDRALVLTFPVDYSFPYRDEMVPSRLLKYSKKEQHAPHTADCIKLSTLRHFRHEHPDLEGIGDPMEGIVEAHSSLQEHLETHDVPHIPSFAHLVEAKVTYQAESTGVIYCTSKPECDCPPNPKYTVASVIQDVPKFAKRLGIEFARQVDEQSFAAVTGQDQHIETSFISSPLDRVVHVFHGPVAYCDDRYKSLLDNKVPQDQRGLAAHFFKETELACQQEYRFVLAIPGKRPIQDTVFLGITPELRSMIEER